MEVISFERTLIDFPGILIIIHVNPVRSPGMLIIIYEDFFELYQILPLTI